MASSCPLPNLTMRASSLDTPNALSSTSAGIPRSADDLPTTGAFMAPSLVWNDTHANPSSPARPATAKLCGTTTICPRRSSPSNTRRPSLLTTCSLALPLVAYTAACALMFQCGARIAFCKSNQTPSINSCLLRTGSFWLLRTVMRPPLGV
ncbi:Os08g0127950 [Oryza sativa Japonica Group]|uniref:Os08g0127950 protein n=1 Tax=Oryza sativa subsp. japonica TaxID=39947 RepID=A0A0P0XBB6_ORYSJ|nr:Os08g0127950 [Oryza sativa Japonica Group]